VTGTRELPRPELVSRRARIRADEWRRMPPPARSALVGRFVGDLARQAQNRGERFRYWPKVRLRWLAPAESGSHQLMDAHPTARDEAPFVELIVETVFCLNDLDALDAITD
jgi:hypothetical protein